MSLSRITLPYYREIADALGAAGYVDLERAERERIDVAQTSREGLAGTIRSLDRSVARWSIAPALETSPSKMSLGR